MRRETARAIHSSTNITFWLENPQWSTGNYFGDIACKGLRILPFSVHEAQKKIFFDKDKVIAVNGESVVAYGDKNNTVDKFMFRYPGDMTTENFRTHVSREVKTVTENLATVALPTSVSVKPALIFRYPGSGLLAVTQTQPFIDISLHPALKLDDIQNEKASPKLDKTAQDLESLLIGADHLISQYGYVPDIAMSSGNLRLSPIDGSVILIDVMPAYLNGSRLIDDTPNNLIDHIQENLQNIQDFVGQYGA